MLITKVNLRRYSWLFLSLLVLPSLGQAGNKGVRYYLSLGTSLSVGVQPDSGGRNQETDEGYSDQLHDLIKPNSGKFRLVKMGRPNETTKTMICGNDDCAYEEGSQLNEAVQFLNTHKSKVALVTIDIGVNDLAVCRIAPDLQGCFESVSQQIIGNLSNILQALNQAAHPNTKIVGMNYYNTFLASWFFDQTLAQASAVFADQFNTGVLGGVYESFGIPMADVAMAFSSNDFEPAPFPPGNEVPTNVARICQWTYMCTPLQNIHANPEGYGVIADTFLGILRP